MKSKTQLSVIFLGALFSILSAQSSATWITLDSLHEARSDPGIVLLSNGNVLIGGGDGGNLPNLSSCEIYEINTGKWRYTKPMNFSCRYGDFILLNTGKVFSIGGYEEKRCELFDPDIETWTMTDSLQTMRITGQSTTELKDGRILVCGGYRDSAVVNTGKYIYLSACEIYDPVTGKWSCAASMNIARSDHTATLLTDGTVLIAGGYGNTLELSSCEIYNPANNTWTVTAPLNEARTNAASILLHNGNIFVSGGESNFNWKKTCEVFDPITKKWAIVPDMADARINHQIFYMTKNNQLLIVGDAIGHNEDTWETYDAINLKPLQYGIFPIQKISIKRNMIEQKDDQILIAGGFEWNYDKNDGMPYLNSSKSCRLLAIITSVSNSKGIPDDYLLCQNYPNPFNPYTEIKYSLSKNGYTKLEIYNMVGQSVRSLVNEYQNAGNYQIIFNANNLPSGIYFYRLLSGAYTQTKKMVLLK